MNIYLIIIKAFLDGEIYLKYSRYIAVELMQSTKELAKAYQCLGLLHDKNLGIKSVDDLELQLLIAYPNLKDSEKVEIGTFLSELRQIVVDLTLIENYLLEMKKRFIGYQLAMLGVEQSEGKDVSSQIQQLTSQLQEGFTITDSEFVTDDVGDLYNLTGEKPAFKWRLKCLNESLGGLVKGDFGFFFANPETGKTTMLASEISYIAQQVERPILWINNEERGRKVMRRIVQSTLGLTKREILSNLESSKIKYKELVGGKIKFKDFVGVHRRDVEALCEEVQPSLIVIDQMDKVHGFEGERDDIAKKKLYAWGREIAKQYAPFIAISQADANAYGKKWLSMKDVDGTKIAKQGEADFMLGIGKTEEEGFEYVRYLHLCKNKGDDDFAEESRRHARMEVIIEPHICRYKDIT